MRKISLLLLLFITTNSLYAQVTFTTIPDNLELIPRDNLNKGTFTIAGSSAYPSSYNIIHTKVINAATSAVIEDKTTSVVNGHFSVQHQVTAALVEYNVLVYIKAGSTETLVKTVSNIVCGDVFIINGQSNAFAAMNEETGGYIQDYLYINKYCRSIGYGYDVATGQPLASDLQWSRPSSLYWASGFVGAWGLRLQYDLANETGIPSCIVNGAKGGVQISQHFASNTPSVASDLHLDKFYDRLYYKLFSHHLTDKVKAIFWYQGEADGLLATCDTKGYGDKFSGLYNSWKADYPNVKKIFMFQINTGCYGDNNSLMRDIHRRLTLIHPDIRLISSIGSSSQDRASDECHYTALGYNRIAYTAKPLVKNDLYNIPAGASAFPPTIVKAYYSNTNQICLEFDHIIFLEPSLTVDGVTHDLKSAFFGVNFSALNIQSISSTANKLYLNIPSNIPKPAYITYVPNNVYPNNKLYVGPWITSADQSIGAPSFHEFPITSQNTGWTKTWSNQDATYLIQGELFYPGDFDGDGTDELLCVRNTGGNADWINLLKFVNGEWVWMWSNYGNPAAGDGIYPYRENLLVGDFDGDGIQELLGNDFSPNGTPGYTTLFRFSNGNWHWTWSDGGSSAHPMRAYKDKMYIGDFNGDGKDEILGCDLPLGQTGLFRWNGSNFASAWSDNNLPHPIRTYRDNLTIGDFDGDGKDEALGIKTGTAALFNFDLVSFRYTFDPFQNKLIQVPIGYQREEFIQGWSNVGLSFNGWQYPLAATDKILSGNIDVADNKDELFFLQTNTAANKAVTMDFKNTQNGWNSNWTTATGGPFINDWPLASSSTDTKYLLVKAKANEPKYLMAMRKNNCNKYAVSMYKASSNSNYRTSQSGNQPSALSNNLSMENETIEIYPNPAHDHFSIKTGVGSVKEIEIYNTQGSLIYKVSSEGKNLVDVNVSDLASGLYLIKIIDNDNQVSSRKIILDKQN